MSQRIIKIFLGSPSDVTDERDALKKVIDEINNSDIASNKEIKLEVICSDKARPGHAQVSEGGQAVLNNQIGNMEEYDLFVGIMWKRIGTQTKNANSGTVEEYNRAVQSFWEKGQPDIWFYFRDLEKPLDSVNSEDEKQQKEVEKFQTEMKKKAFIKTYSDVKKFEKTFFSDINSWLNVAENNTLLDISSNKRIELIQEIAKEIATKNLNRLKKSLLFKNQKQMTDEKKELLKQVIEKISEELSQEFSNKQEEIEERLCYFLLNCKQELLSEPNEANYAAGNILNLLLKLDLKKEKNFSYFDLSDISIWEADLREAILTGVDLSNSDLKNSSFSEPLGCIHSIAFNADGRYFATGDAHGLIRVYNTESLETRILNKERKNQIWSVAFSSNTQFSQMLAWGAEDGSVKVLNILNIDGDSSSNNDIRSKNIYESIYESNEGRRILSVAFSPDGNLFAIGGDGDKAIKLVEINNHNNQKGILDASDVSCMTFIDNKRIACGTQDGHISILYVDKNNQNQDRIMRNVHTGVVRCIACDGDKKRLASGGEDGKVKMFNTSNLESVKFDSPEKISQVRTLAFSKHSKDILAVGCIDKNSEGESEHKIWLWDFEERRWNKMDKSNGGHKYLIRSIAFCPNRNQPRLLISGGDGRTVKLWDINSRKCNHTLKGYANRIWSVAFSKDGETFACGGEDNKIHLWKSDDRTHIPIQTLSQHTGWVWSVAFSPKANILASGCEDNKIFLWQLNGENWEYTSELTKHDKRVRCVAFNPDGDKLASAGNDNRVVLWDIKNVQSPQLLKEFIPHSDRVLSLAFSPDGNYLASSSRDKTICLIKIETLKEINLNNNYKDRHNDQVHSIAFRPNSNQSISGNKLISGGFDKKLKLWEVTSDENNSAPSVNHIRTWSGNQKILSVAFHPTKAIVASAGDNHVIMLWDISDADNKEPTMIKKLKGHKGVVESIAFSHDGNKLISCSQDQTIKFWEINGVINISIHTIELGKPYQGMNIFGVKNLEDTQILALEELGASRNV